MDNMTVAMLFSHSLIESQASEETIEADASAIHDRSTLEWTCQTLTLIAFWCHDQSIELEQTTPHQIDYYTFQQQ